RRRSAAPIVLRRDAAGGGAPRRPECARRPPLGSSGARFPTRRRPRYAARPRRARRILAVDFARAAPDGKCSHHRAHRQAAVTRSSRCAVADDDSALICRHLGVHAERSAAITNTAPGNTFLEWFAAYAHAARATC